MISNTKLYDRKKTVLTSIVPNSEVSFFKFSCSYHDVNISFKSIDSDFIESLKKFIPTSWHIDDKDSDFEITLHAPSHFNMDIKEWCDEDSQDCYFNDEEGVAIQRDFAAKVLNPYQIYVICELKICDGLFNFLRWFLPRQLLKSNSYVLHSACLLDKTQKAHFFLGHSGAGKTTITKLSNRSVLGDDMNIIKIYDGKIFAKAGAIGGAIQPDVDYDESFEIKSFNWIVQSDNDRREILSPSSARIKLLASVTNIFWEYLKQDETEKIFEDIEKIIESIPVYELHFKKSADFWKLIERE